MDEWTSGRRCGEYGMCVCVYVCMCVCVCMHMCELRLQQSPDTLGGENETVRWRHGGMDGWMDGLCGEEGTPFEIQPCGQFPLRKKGGWAAFEPNAALRSKVVDNLVAAKSW